MDVNFFVNITSRAWALPILASLHAGVPGRQASLLTATGASRTAFAQSMEHLIEIGLLECNPGYGHPLRPEFRLTPLGQSVAELASNIQRVSKGDEKELLRRSWTVPVLTVLHKPSQFTEIKRSLVTITDRALSQSLRSLEEQQWVRRSVNGTARPPRPLYCAINTGAEISHATHAAISLG